MLMKDELPDDDAMDEMYDEAEDAYVWESREDE
jgi:hypothetical protein